MWLFGKKWLLNGVIVKEVVDFGDGIQGLLIYGVVMVFWLVGMKVIGFLRWDIGDGR